MRRDHSVRRSETRDHVGAGLGGQGVGLSFWVTVAATTAAARLLLEDDARLGASAGRGIGRGRCRSTVHAQLQ